MSIVLFIVASAGVWIGGYQIGLYAHSDILGAGIASFGQSIILGMAALVLALKK